MGMLKQTGAGLYVTNFLEIHTRMLITANLGVIKLFTMMSGDKDTFIKHLTST